MQNKEQSRIEISNKIKAMKDEMVKASDAGDSDTLAEILSSVRQLIELEQTNGNIPAPAVGKL